MKSGLATFLVAAAVLVLGGASAQAQGYGNCPPWRPCGPGNSYLGNRLVPQGFYGADFRSACAQHDACYATPGTDRAACDQQFLDNMLCACASSSNPRACERKARHYYRTARTFGGLYRD